MKKDPYGSMGCGAFMICIVLSLFIYSYSKTIAWKESVCIYTDMRAYSYKHTARGGDISTKYEVVVNYSYDFENKIYSGSFSNQGYNSKIDAEAYMRQMRQKGSGICYVNPARPSETTFYRMKNSLLVILILLDLLLFVASIIGFKKMK